MRRRLLFAFLLAACSKGSQADLEYIKQARSAAAEWALVNEQAGRGKLTEAYVRSMHQWLRDEIETASKGLTQPEARYAVEIHALLSEPDDVSPTELRAHVAKLKKIEDGLESA